MHESKVSERHSRQDGWHSMQIWFYSRELLVKGKVDEGQEPTE